MKALTFLLIVFSLGCSNPRPKSKPDAVQTGDATAKKAADAARAAESANSTGILVASSNVAQPATQPEPTTQPAAPEPESAVLEVKFENGALTQHGVPIADFAKIAADAVAADPEVALSIVSSEAVEQQKIVEITDAAKAAGIKRIKVKIVVEQAEPTEAPTTQ